MNTHVFIVDSTTFKLHLEYLFAGTGAGDKIVDFNNRRETDLHPTSEGMLASMISDASRIRKGDYIIFYLQQSVNENIKDGKFYGIFKAKNNGSFLDNLTYYEQTLNLQNNYSFRCPSTNYKFKINNKKVTLKTALTLKEKKRILASFSSTDRQKIEKLINDFYANNQYLLEELEKSLTFRTLIEPFKVYPKGVTEWEALDEIKVITSPNQMLWSLIYRKLKGKRGNTMITIYESDRLCQLIRNKNNRKKLKITKKLLTFDKVSEEIVSLNQKPKEYEGRQEEIDIYPRLLAKYGEGKSFEPHLQAFIVVNIGLKENNLDDLLINNGEIEWIGNEVSCGVGMQRIDIMLSIIEDDQRVLFPIELKAVEADETNVIQIQRYIDWIEQYYIPNRQSDIQPVLVSKKINNKKTPKYKKLIDSFEGFNKCNGKFDKLRFVEFFVDEDKVIFEEVNY